ncbi:MAG: copper chaperone PCu(A)C [Parvularculaceae bacterium]
MRLPLLIACAGLLAACGNGAPGGPAPKGKACAASGQGPVRVENAWMRAQSDPGGMSAAYFTICNATSESVTIEGVAAPAAGLIELHETSRDTAGVVSMAPTGPIVLAAGEEAVFEPGGKHAMMMNLIAPIDAGSPQTLTIELAGGESVTVDAMVMTAADAASHHH